MQQSSTAKVTTLLNLVKCMDGIKTGYFSLSHSCNAKNIKKIQDFEGAVWNV